MEQNNGTLLQSRTNERIKFALQVRKSARVRRENGLFFLEGARLCSDAAADGTVVSVCLYTDKAAEKYPDRLQVVLDCAESVFRITEDLSSHLSETENPQGIFCLCRMRRTEAEIRPDGKYAALSFVQNPDNLGAISRTAEALGLDGLIVENGCDVYNPKAQRAAMGSLLRLPVVQTDDLCALLDSCRKNGMRVYASTPDSSAEKITEADFSGGVVCVIGNEGSGIREELLNTCDKITIPMLGRAESFNAAAAASILLWEMMREETP